MTRVKTSWKQFRCFALACTCVSAAQAGEPITMESLLSEMVDRDAVARFPQPDFRLRQQSSYDRLSKTPDDPDGWFANKDHTKNFVRIETNDRRREWVLMEHDGPGALVRSWMPDKRIPSGGKTPVNTTVRIYLDGADKPAIEGHALDLSLKLGSYADPQVTRSVVLKIEFDGRQTVWCPAGDFFGTGVGLHPFEGWWRTVAEGGKMACRWVMPYRKAGRITLVNLHGKPVTANLIATVDDWKWDDRSMYFHAGWRHRYPVPTRPFSDFNYNTLNGRGVYAGDTLTVMNPLVIWWGEGDAKIWVDGEGFPSIFGTGTEDYYAYSWGGKHTAFYEHPFHAQVRVGRFDKVNRKKPPFERDTKGYSTETRTRALDTMPFSRSLQVDMEVWHWKECDMAYAVATYWYGDADTRTNRTADAADRSAAGRCARAAEEARGAGQAVRERRRVRNDEDCGPDGRYSGQTATVAPLRRPALVRCQPPVRPRREDRRLCGSAVSRRGGRAPQVDPPRHAKPRLRCVATDNQRAARGRRR